MEKQIFQMISAFAGEQFWAQIIRADTLPVGAKALWQQNELVYGADGLRDFWQTARQTAGKQKKAGLIEVVWQGETVQIYQESISRVKKLIVCGGGHISLAVNAIGQMLGFAVTVIDDRPTFANPKRFPGAKTICKPFIEALREVAYGPDSFFVIVTRGHAYDRVCLAELLHKEYAYLGMIGSRLRVKKIKEQMLAAGFRQDLLAALHAPIGLEIGAETPEEIAVSIMAEIVREKSRLALCGGFPAALLKGLIEREEEAALLTIVERKGSAPRETGAKMVVLRGGDTVGTIGGGCVEADVKRSALYAMDTGQPFIKTADITGRDAAEEGMACGGIVTIFIDPLVNGD